MKKNVRTSPQYLGPVLCSISRYKDENLLSFLMRLAVHNEYDPPELFIRCIQEVLRSHGLSSTLWTFSDDRIFAFLATITWLDIADLRAALPPSYMSVRKENVLSFCPLCVAESPYYRIPWMVDVCTACIDHNCLLINQCSECGSTLPMRSVIEAICHTCGTSFQNMQIVSLRKDTSGLIVQRMVYNWIVAPFDVDSLQFNVGLPTFFPEILYGVASNWRHTLRHCSQHWGYVQRWKVLIGDQWAGQPREMKFKPPTQQRWNVPDMMNMHTSYTVALLALQDWPYNFYHFLAEAPIEWEKFVNFHHPDYAFVRRAFEQFVGAYVLPGLELIGRSKEVPRLKTGTPKYIACTAAQQMLDVSSRVIQHLIAAKRLFSQIVAQQVFVRVREVEQLQQTWNQPLKASVAARWLGVSIDVVHELAVLKVLPVIDEQRLAGEQRLYFEKRSIVDLIDAISELERVPDRWFHGVPIEAASQRVGVSIARILQLILDERIRCWRNGDASVSVYALRVYPSQVKSVNESVEKWQS